MNERAKSSHPLPIDENVPTREAWKVFQIMAEFVEGSERLAAIRPSVSIFGSARTSPEHPSYRLAEGIGRALWKVIPVIGRPHYLMDQDGYGRMRPVSPSNMRCETALNRLSFGASERVSIASEGG